MITPEDHPARPELAASLAAVRPTHTRYWVIVFAITLAVIQYIDRVCISQAAPFISKDLGLSKPQMGLVFSAFVLAYALFEIPTGYMGDKIGPRRVLMRVVLWWSFFTAATGWVWNWISLVIVRFLFGAGEAGCFPNLTKAFDRWLPLRERIRAQGIMWMSARWGGAFKRWGRIPVRHGSLAFTLTRTRCLPMWLQGCSMVWRASCWRVSCRVPVS
jgi:MFS family permease